MTDTPTRSRDQRLPDSRQSLPECRPDQYGGLVRLSILREDWRASPQDGTVTVEVADRARERGEESGYRPRAGSGRVRTGYG